MADEARILNASWACERERAAMIAIRRAVFIVEQGVPEDLELDGLDADCRHLLAVDANGEPVGTARIQASGHIGRIAVRAEWRGRGVGSRMLERFIEQARAAGLGSVDLDSQVHALAFYEKHGFASRGDVFMDAGIPHKKMVRSLR